MDYRLSSEYEFNVVNHLFRIPVDLLLLRTTINSYIIFEKHNVYWKKGAEHALENFGLTTVTLLAKTKRLAHALGNGVWNPEVLALLLRGGTYDRGISCKLEEEIMHIKQDLKTGFLSLRSEYYEKMELAKRDRSEWGNLSLPDPVDMLFRITGDLSSCFLPLEKKRFSTDEVHRMFRSHWMSEFFAL